MRLIDADELKLCYTGSDTNKASYLSIRKMIDTSKTTYDIDKVVEELKCENCESCRFLEVCAGSKYCGKCHERIIEIVKQGGVSDDVCECRLLKGYNFLHKTSCGDVFEMENGFKFCPYCGKKIKIVGG